MWPAETGGQLPGPHLGAVPFSGDRWVKTSRNRGQWRRCLVDFCRTAAGDPRRQRLFCCPQAVRKPAAVPARPGARETGQVTRSAQVEIRGLRFGYAVTDGQEWTVPVGLLDALNLDQVDLVGHSLGGLLGCLAASAAPDRFRKLVLEDVAVPHPREPSPLVRPEGELDFDRDMVVALRAEIDRPSLEWSTPPCGGRPAELPVRMALRADAAWDPTRTRGRGPSYVVISGRRPRRSRATCAGSTGPADAGSPAAGSWAWGCRSDCRRGSS